MQSIEQEKSRKESHHSLNQKKPASKQKAEEYTIKRNGQTDWQRCHYLGSLSDTEEDIKTRKALANTTDNKLKNILENKSI